MLQLGISKLLSALFQFKSRLFGPRFICTITNDNHITVSTDSKRIGPSILYSMGYYGKGSLSRAEPTWFARHYLGFESKSLAEQRQIESFNGSKCEWYNDRLDREVYILMPEEAFYLYCHHNAQMKSGNGFVGSIQELWDLFCSKFYTGDNQSCTFVARYAVYSYYKDKGWIVKSGLQFGGDFCNLVSNLVLYRLGPDQDHAEYLVWIITNGTVVPALDLAAKSRCANQVQKKLALCHVELPETVNEYSRLHDIKIRDFSTERFQI